MAIERYEALRNKPFPQLVADVVAMLHSGLETYGKKADGALIQAWMLALGKHEATNAEVLEVGKHWIDKEKFPSTGEVVDWIQEQREFRAREERLALTMNEVKRENAEHRARLIAAGLDPDALVPSAEVKKAIENIERKALEIPLRVVETPEFPPEQVAAVVRLGADGLTDDEIADEEMMDLELVKSITLKHREEINRLSEIADQTLRESFLTTLQRRLAG
jgi:hypothetical protein